MTNWFTWAGSATLSRRRDWLRRSLIAAGHCVVLCLLVTATIQLFDLRTFGKSKEAGAHRAYQERDRVLEGIRHPIDQSTDQVRIFLESNRPDRLESFRTVRVQAETESHETLGRLSAMRLFEGAVPGMRAAMGEYWQAMGAAEDWQKAGRNATFESVQQELNSRRLASLASLHTLEEANQQALAGTLSQIEGRRLQRWFFLALSILTALVVALMLAAYSLAYARDLQRQGEWRYNELATAKEDLEKLSARILHLQEHERRHLSRELHDGIGQILTALRIEISRAQSLPGGAAEERAESLRRARALAEEAVRTVRNVSLILRPTLLDDLGLEPALRWYAEEFTRRTGIGCQWTITGLGPLPDDWNTCVYRVVQEAIHNIEKHAAPTRVHITVVQRPGSLEVEVEDNGRGFDPSAKRSSGFGLLGMRERAQTLGGTLTVDSAPGHGTKVSLRLPLSKITETGAPPEPPAAAEMGAGKKAAAVPREAGS